MRGCFSTEVHCLHSVCLNCPIDFLFAGRDSLLTVLHKQMRSLVRTNGMAVQASDPYCQVHPLPPGFSLFLSVGVKVLNNALEFLDEYSHVPVNSSSLLSAL